MLTCSPATSAAFTLFFVPLAPFDTCSTMLTTYVVERYKLESSVESISSWLEASFQHAAHVERSLLHVAAPQQPGFKRGITVNAGMESLSCHRATG
jgi:hypothetical protein